MTCRLSGKGIVPPLACALRRWGRTQAPGTHSRHRVCERHTAWRSLELDQQRRAPPPSRDPYHLGTACEAGPSFSASCSFADSRAGP